MKKLGRILLVMAMFLCVPVLSAKAENGVGISDNQNGTVTITYENSSQKRIAVIVKKLIGDTSSYNYFSTARKVDVDVPLTLGNGVYEITVLKNIANNRYSTLSSREVELALKDIKKAYLTSNQMINWSKKNAEIKYANKITKKCKTQYAKIAKIHKYIVTNYHYDYKKFSKNSNGGLTYYTPNNGTTYRTKKGICYDIAALNASMLRSMGIQTKLITGYPKNAYFNGVSYHAWNKVYSSSKKKWLILDVTCDMCLYEQKTKYKKLKMEKKAKEYSNVKKEYQWSDC